MSFIHNLERKPAQIPDASDFKIHEFAYRLFPVLIRLFSKLDSEILLDGQACRNLYSASLEAIDQQHVPPQEIALMHTFGIELPSNMNLVAITAEDNQLVARLSDGQVIRCRHSDEMASLLAAEGVIFSDVRVPDWRAGGISPERGKKISIFGLLRKAELRRE